MPNEDDDVIQQLAHRLQLDGDPEDVCTGAAKAALGLAVDALEPRPCCRARR